MMDEYIKREDVIKHLRGACIAKYPLSFSYGIFASADEISKLPTAEVVPKSDVDLYKRLNDELEDELASTYDKLENAKQEVARKIFAEIETALKHSKQYDLRSGTYFECYLEGYIANLKKKYTEGETKDYFSPEEVRNMSHKEVRENYQAIMKSMEKWGEEK